MALNNELDRTDYELIALLQKNARLSNKELAAEVGLAQSTCLERIRKLTARGVITGYHADIEPKAFGFTLQALISVRLSRHSKKLVQEFHQHVLGLPEVVNLFHIAGENDFLVQVAVRDSDHLRTLALESFTTWPEIDHIETALIFEHAKKALSPALVTTES